MIFMDEADLLDQAGMERAFLRYFEDLRKNCSGTVNDMLKPELLSCDYARRNLTLRATTEHWMTNPNGILHGGVTSAYLDLVMGLVCRYCVGGFMTPTLHIDVNYLRSIQVGKSICISGYVTKLGSKICYTEGKIWEDGNPTRLLVTASGSYYVSR